MCYICFLNTWLFLVCHLQFVLTPIDWRLGPAGGGGAEWIVTPHADRWAGPRELMSEWTSHMQEDGRKTQEDVGH